MKKIIFLILISSAVFGQINGVYTVEPLTVVDSAGVKFATLGYTNNWFSGKRYAYWKSDNIGNLFWGGNFITGTRSNDSTTTVSNLPSPWSDYTIPCVINDGDFLATWDVTPSLEYELRAEQFGDSLYVTQVLNSSDPHTFVVRGKNFLLNTGAGVEANVYSDSDCQDLFSGGNTGLGGLLPPPNFTAPDGYLSYYTEDSTLAYTDNLEFNPSSELFVMTPVAITTVNNIVNLEQFPDVTPHPNLKFVFGHGSPLFTDMAADGQLAIQLKKGWTHTANSGALGVDEIPESATSQWVNPTDYFDGVFGLTQPDSSVTDQAAINAGKAYAASRCCIYNPDLATFSKDLNHMMFNEERWNPYGDMLRVKGRILQGIRQQLGSSLSYLVNYGNATTSFYTGNPSKYHSHEFTDAERYQSISYFTTEKQGFRDAAWSTGVEGSGSIVGLYRDISGGYFRTPVPQTSSLYKKHTNGDYIIQNGSRIFREDDFTEVIFGENTTFLGDAADDAYAVQQNFPLSIREISDAFWSVNQQYLLYDQVIGSIMSRSNFYRNSWDITTYHNDPQKGAVVIRPVTENGTYGGNANFNRQVGEGGLRFMVYVPLLSGAEGLETWDDGTGGENNLSDPSSNETYIIKSFGNELYPSSNTGGNRNKYSAYEVLTAAVQDVQKVFNGVAFDSTLRYVHFCDFIHGFRDKEIIGSGIYQADTMHLVLSYPYADPQDVFDIELMAGGLSYSFSLVGRNPKIYKFVIPTGLQPNEISIRYDNIDGTEIHVTGDLQNRVPSSIIYDTGDPVDLYFATENIGNIGQIYCGLNYQQLQSEISGGVSIFNYFGNPNESYLSPRTGCNVGFQTYTNDHVAVNFPSHSVNLSGDSLIAKVHYKVFDSNQNLVAEVYDTKGGYSPDGNRTNNHPDQATRWLKKGTYTVWMKNISDENVVINARAGYTSSGQLESLHSSSISKGQSVLFTVNLDGSHFGGDWYFYKLNCNVY